jgi:hypothetical protein
MNHVQRYHSLDLERYVLADGRVLFHGGAGKRPQLLSARDARLLLACGTARPLEEHMRTCAAIMADAGAGGVGDARALVDQFLAAGLLTPEVVFSRELLGSPSAGGAMPHDSLAVLCIPTRDRPDLLERALDSYLGNAAAHARELQLRVMDDSEEHSLRTRELARVAGSRHGHSVWYASRARRERFAARLALHAGAPEEVVHFAMFGRPGAGAAYGAVRNALLLDTAGMLSVHVDDDTVCELTCPPDPQGGLELSASGDPNDYWPARNFEDARSLVCPADADFMALHEALLGRTPRECMAQTLDRGEDLRARGPSYAVFRDDLLAASARITLTFNGIVGDCGGPARAEWRLGLSGAPYERLVADPHTFDALMRSRHMVKCPRAQLISTGMYCMTGGIGIDNRGLVPPFVPNGIAEDVAFGVLNRLMNPTGVSGFAPYAVDHRPGLDRGSQVGAGPRRFLLNRVIAQMFGWLQQVWPVTDPQSVLRLTGRFFVDLAGMAPEEFSRFVRKVMYGYAVTEVAAIDRLLTTRPGAPRYWQDRVEAWRKATEELLVGDAPSSPHEFSGSPDERRRQFQALLGEYGALLCWWPSLRQAAAELRDSGGGLMEELR